jgi:hypothetical protein
VVDASSFSFSSSACRSCGVKSTARAWFSRASRSGGIGSAMFQSREYGSKGSGTLKCGSLKSFFNARRRSSSFTFGCMNGLKSVSGVTLSSGGTGFSGAFAFSAAAGASLRFSRFRRDQRERNASFSSAMA